MQISAPRDVILWEPAAAVAAAAVRWTDEAGLKVNIAVADASANLMAVLRMLDALLRSIDIEIDKAYAAAGFVLPTRD